MLFLAILQAIVSLEVIVKQCSYQLFGKFSDQLPLDWAKVGTEYETTSEDEEIANDRQECAHCIRMVFEQLVARFDIIGIHGNVLIGEGDAQVSYPVVLTLNSQESFFVDSCASCLSEF